MCQCLPDCVVGLVMRIWGKNYTSVELDPFDKCFQDRTFSDDDLYDIMSIEMFPL
jgi:hypothetical protein